MSDKGEQGVQGERGPQGPRGPQGESKVNTTADAAVAALVKAASWSKRAIVSLIVMGVALASIVGYLVYSHVQQGNQLVQLKQYDQMYAQHSCSALELLTKTPVAEPADPAANPSRETTYKFYVALKYWEVQDHCK